MTLRIAPLRIAMIGLGDIARKAYLPVLGPRADLDLVFVTRDAQTLAALGAAWRVERLHAQLDTALAEGLDGALVHAATAAHPDIVRRLLEAGVPTLVDKPLADNAADSEALVDLAETRGVSLMVGFNRRFAPVYRDAAALGLPLTVMQKNRADQADHPRRVVFDDFIHVVDTLRFLAPGAGDARVHGRVVDGLLQHVALSLSGDGRDALGVMNRVSGANEETLEVSGEVSGAGAKRRIVDMAQVVDQSAQDHLTRRGDWTPVGRQRGFEGLCDHFLSAVRDGRRLSALDALGTHRLCETVVRALDA
ncbi:oxidoreductase [Caulobacter sp. Root1455]|uniref:Gfo/Idh/MocA family protein n=1 Tax=unclassified Caulobacter TaxID=2648921 RepID=UPI0006FF3510|nr:MULTISPECIES: Gfo/Idh/MocA family oxidoreductase [unclassified Caulobacter]KQY29850.1 oxidoreductase [Caulobacter sp. Root487D2Y]KQZ05850.1 oxidoreductase [Caulobacter sp. Root1455]